MGGYKVGGHKVGGYKVGGHKVGGYKVGVLTNRPSVYRIHALY